MKRLLAALFHARLPAHASYSHALSPPASIWPDRQGELSPRAGGYHVLPASCALQCTAAGAHVLEHCCLGRHLLAEAYSTHSIAAAAQTSCPEGSLHVQAFGRVDEDGSRYLLGDTRGQLYMLVLNHDGRQVVGLKLETLGRTSAASALAYLDSGVVFVVGFHCAQRC